MSPLTLPISFYAAAACYTSVYSLSLSSAGNNGLVVSLSNFSVLNVSSHSLQAKVKRCNDPDKIFKYMLITLYTQSIFYDLQAKAAVWSVCQRGRRCWQALWPLHVDLRALTDHSHSLACSPHCQKWVHEWGTGSGVHVDDKSGRGQGVSRA